MRAGLADGSRGSAGTVWRRFGSKFVALELGMAMVLLVGAGLLGQSLYRLLQVDLGFRPEQLATLTLAAPDKSYGQKEQSVVLGRKIVSRVARQPGVESVGLSSTLPLHGAYTFWIRVVGRPYNGEHNEVNKRKVSSGYFGALAATLWRGRWFGAMDDASNPPVVIINRALASKYFPGEDPIGKQIAYALSSPAEPMEIVGVINDIKEEPLDSEVFPTVYVPFEQDPTDYFSLVVRTRQANEQRIFPALVAAIHGIDPGIAVFDEKSMTHRINESQAAYLHRCSAWLVGGFALLALLLGVIGLYGVIAYSVSQRTREIGVRMALGAERSAVYGLILREAAWLISSGIVAGALCSIAAAASIRHLLFGVAAYDVPTLAAVGGLLGLFGLLASFLPARRAARINPLEALRSE
jgi:predicted permease